MNVKTYINSVIISVNTHWDNSGGVVPTKESLEIFKNILYNIHLPGNWEVTAFEEITYDVFHISIEDGNINDIMKAIDVIHSKAREIFKNNYEDRSNNN